MRSIVIQDRSGESLQDVIARIEKKKRFVKTVPKPVHLKITRTMRREAKARALIDKRKLGEDY